MNIKRGVTQWGAENLRWTKGRWFVQAEEKRCGKMVLWALRSVNVMPQFPCIAEKEGNKLVKENGFLYSLARAGERKVLRFCLPLL